jgi:hypothetical protein
MGGVPRLKGNIFPRRNNAHNQNSTGIERAPGLNGASDPSVSAYPGPPVMPGDGLAFMSQPGVVVGGQPQHLQQQPYPSHPQHPQQYPQQQQQTQQLYAPQFQQHPQYPQQQQYLPQGQQQQAHLYAQQQKKTRPGQRAGAAILNGMRNLNIGSAMNRIGGGVKSPGGSPNRANNKRQQPPSQRKQQPVNVNEWESRWDEDSDDEDDDVIKPGMLPQQHQQHPVGGAAGIPPTAPIPPQLGPPELDSGYAGAASAAASIVPAAAEQLQQQQQSIYPPSAPSAATPGPLVGTQQTPSEPKSPNQQIVTDDENDDVEWDTGASGNAAGLPSGEELDDSSTLNVKHFLPLLRVLGKGSFGKVRIGNEKFK